MNTLAVEAHGIGKSYGKVEALCDVDLEVQEGEVFGLIGADGSGKTTFFRILTTLILPGKGSARVNGFDIVTDWRRIRDSIGYMPGKFSLYQDLTVEENIEFFAAVFNTSLAENYGLVREMYEQIEPFKDRRAGELSGGMKQKLALCAALIHRPSVLFLDEPTTGVDPVSRKELWDMLSRLKAEGISILVSTPFMDEASRCDRVSLISGGTILETGTPQEITAGFCGELYAVRGANLPALLRLLRTFPGAESCYSFGDSLHLTVKPDTGASALSAWLGVRCEGDIGIERIAPSIEDRFLNLSVRAS